MGILRALRNVIWWICGGIWLALSWCVLGLLLCITIVGIPFGIQCFKAAKLSFVPFGKRVFLNFGEHPIANLLWAIFIGWELALAYIFAGIITCITIIGIPYGLLCFKITKLAFAPFGARISK